jgi:peptidyl-prolyl cis-trans isomerase D
MLRFLRKYSNSTGIKILYGLLACLFIIWGVGAIGGERIDLIARVQGQPITRTEVDRTAASLQRRYEELLRGQFSPEMARSLDLRGKALDQLIDQALLRHEAARLGLGVSDAELVEAITRMPELQDNGHFDRDRLEQILRFQRDRGEFEVQLRESLVFQHLQSLVTDGVQVSDAEVEDRYRRDHEQVDLIFVRTSAAALAEGVTPTDDELRQYLAAHADHYRTPTTVRARYVAYRPADFAAQVQISDGDVAEYYELNKEEKFVEPEAVHARHLLVAVTPDATPEAKDAARKKAQGLLARVKGGEDFATLAKQSSDDKVTAAKGGDLGFLSRGRMSPGFDEAAFALEPGATSDLVETPLGFDVIRVEEHRAAGVKPLEAVREQIVETLRHDRAFELARQQAEADRRRIVRGTPFAEALSGRKLEETPPFAADAEVPGIGRAKEFSDTALALGPNEVSDLIETADAIYLLTPFERIEAHTPPLEEIHDRVAADVRRERGQAAAKAQAEKLRTRAKEVGLERAAADAGLTVDQTGPFDRLGAIPKLPGATDLRTDAYALTLEAPLAPNVYIVGGDAVVAALHGRTPADMSGFAAAKDGLRATLLDRKRQAVMTAYLDHLKERAHQEGEFEVHPEKLAQG